MNNKRFFNCLVLTVVVLIVLPIVAAHFIHSWNRDSAIEATKEWARLAEFPPSATNVTVVAEGGMFTREFIVEFRASREEIESWLNRSPGTKGVQPVIEKNVRRYQIRPGEGAQFAELEFYPKERRIRIRTYWS